MALLRLPCQALLVCLLVYPLSDPHLIPLGKHPQGEPQSGEGAPGAGVPDPTSLAVSAADAKSQAQGDLPGKEHDKTKVPMETAMWTKMRPVMHGIADVTDGWERFAK
jgi:hypothetical protein